MRKEVEEHKEWIVGDLESVYRNEDKRLQSALNNLCSAVAASGNEGKVPEALQKARAELVIKQTYKLCTEHIFTFGVKIVNLVTKNEIALEWMTNQKNSVLPKLTTTTWSLSSSHRTLNKKGCSVKIGLRNTLSIRSYCRRKGMKEMKIRSINS